MGETHTVESGYDGGLGLAVESSFNDAVTPPTKYLEIESDSFDETRNWFNSDGITGSRSRAKTGSAPTTLDPRGGTRMSALRRAELSFLLPLALGGYGGGSGYPSDDLPSFTAVKKAGGEAGVFSGCKLTRLDLESSDSAQALAGGFECVAAGFAAGAEEDFGTPVYDVEIPLVHAGSDFQIGGASVQVKAFKLSIANKLDESVFRCSRTRLALPVVGKREVSGELTLDWNAATRASVLAVWRDDAYALFQATFTNGLSTVVISLPYCRLAAGHAKLAKDAALEMPVKFEAFASLPEARDEIQVFSA